MCTFPVQKFITLEIICLLLFFGFYRVIWRLLQKWKAYATNSFCVTSKFIILVSQNYMQFFTNVWKRCLNLHTLKKRVQLKKPFWNFIRNFLFRITAILQTALHPSRFWLIPKHFGSKFLCSSNKSAKRELRVYLVASK